MAFYANMGTADAVFKNKKLASSYYVREEEDCYCYNISFSVDIEKALNKKLQGIDFYVIERSRSSRATRKIPDLFSSIDFDTNSTQAAAAMGYQNADMAYNFLERSRGKKAFLGNISYLSTLDLQRYKKNIRGTKEERFGTESTRFVTYQKVTDDHLLSESLFERDPGNRRSSHASAINKSLLIDGLLSGKGLISVMGYDRMISKSVLDSHLITSGEERRKSNIKIAKNEERLNEIREYFTQIISRQSSATIPNISKSNSVKKIMRINSEIKIPKKILEQKRISKNLVSIVLETRDRTGTYTLDRFQMDLNLSQDLKYSALSMNNLTLKSSTSSKSVPCFNFNAANHQKATEFTEASTIAGQSTDEDQLNEGMSVDVFYSYIDKLLPIFSNNYASIAQLDLEKMGAKSSHELRLTRSRAGSNSSRLTRYSPPIFDTPHFIRCKPTMQGVKIDNCLESSIAKKGFYQTSFIGFYVKSNPSSQNRKGFMRIVVPPTQIDPTISKIRPVKINRTKHPHGGEKYFQVARNRDNTPTEFITIDSGQTLEFSDYDIENNDTYEYKLQIIRNKNAASPEYSVNSFFEQGVYAKGAVILSVDSESPDAQSIGSDKILINCSFKTSEVQDIFNALLRDKFDLFQEDIAEIRDASSPVIKLLCEQIDTATGTVRNLGLYSPSGTITDGELVSFSINTPPANCVYKLTPLVAPVAELVALVEQEIVSRFDNRANYQSGLNYFNFSGLKKKIANLDTQTLSSLSTRFTTAGMQANKLIVDSETITARNAGDVFRTASTGDVFYHDFIPSNFGSDTANSEKGFENYSDAFISYYPSSENKKMTKNKFNNSRINHKFVIDIECKFGKDIDHCAIFSMSEGRVNFECALHVELEKTNYRALIEKDFCNDTISFYAIPVSKSGRIMSPKHLGNFRK